MAASKHAYITYETEPGHMHLVPLGDGQVAVLETEEAAELLAEAVAACNPLKANGRGRTHTHEQVKSAYMSAIYQLLNTDFEEEWRQEEWKRFLHQKWNGGVRVHPQQKMRPVPDAIILPIDGANDWKLMMPDRRTGDPVILNLNKRFLKDIAESIPPPTDKNSVKAEVGFYSKEKK